MRCQQPHERIEAVEDAGLFGGVGQQLRVGGGVVAQQPQQAHGCVSSEAEAAIRLLQGQALRGAR